VDVPDVRYARSGDVSIAYQVVGEGPPDLVFLMFFSNLYTLWRFPRFAEFGRALASERRVVFINPRGAGLSDSPRGFTIESRVDDIRAVIDDLGLERQPLIGIGEAAATSAVFAASYPDRVYRLVLYTPWVHTTPEQRAEELSGLAEMREALGAPRLPGGVRALHQPAMEGRPGLRRLVRVEPPADRQPECVG
jgi:pimeloyl-ACP methyl ester carboxylesterase